MAEVHHYHLDSILQDLKIEASDADPVGQQLIRLALEAETEIFDGLAAASIAEPTTTDASLTSIVNQRTEGKWIKRTDRDGGQKIIDYTDKLLTTYITKKKKSQQVFQKTAGPEA